MIDETGSTFGQEVALPMESRSSHWARRQGFEDIPAALLDFRSWPTWRRLLRRPNLATVDRIESWSALTTS